MFHVVFDGVLQVLSDRVFHFVFDGVLHVVFDGVLQVLSDRVFHVVFDGVLHVVFDGVLHVVFDGVLHVVFDRVLHVVFDRVLHVMCDGVLTHSPGACTPTTMPSSQSSAKVASSTEQKLATRAKRSVSRVTMKSEKDRVNIVTSITTCSQRTSRTTLPPHTIASGASVVRRNSDISPSYPLAGEKPNDLLRRLLQLWPTSSYRPSTRVKPEATAEYNMRILKARQRPRFKVRVSTVVAVDASLTKKAQMARSMSLSRPLK